jgi:uncharacterized protein YutE (UPF0331/DUF86 family)
MKLNEQLIRTRCSEIGASLHRLRQMRTMPAGEFSATKDAQDIAAYRLLVAIEAALSICFHLVAKKAKRAPRYVYRMLCGNGRGGPDSTRNGGKAPAHGSL